MPRSFSGFLPWAFSVLLAVLALAAWLALRGTAARLASADAKLSPLQAGLDAALARIQGFAESQARFVGGLAQEIKAPLATVLIHAELLVASSNDAATVQRYAKGLAEDIRHLSDLVESFLRLARPITEEDTRHHVPVHFHDLVLEAVRRCQSLAGTRAVSVVPMLADPDGDPSVEVLGDAVLLVAMIENLVRNAVLSAPRETRVDLHVRIQGERVLLSVRDHGAKIDDDRLHAVFDGLLRVTAPPQPFAATALSLAIAKRVAEHHRGTISLRSAADGGCEFEVQLPRWRASTQLPPSGETPARMPYD